MPGLPEGQKHIQEVQSKREHWRTGTKHENETPRQSPMI